jgi:hypothetical protein
MPRHFFMRINLAVACLIGCVGLGVGSGCYPAPQRATLAPGSAASTYTHDPVKPMPSEADASDVSPTYEDAPLVSQQIPEDPRFVEAYNHVGRPKIMIIVNHTENNGIDYALIEETLTDWLSAEGQVQIISPMLARQKLTDQQLQELASGQPQVMDEVAQKLQTDVLVYAECPSRQTPQGPEVMLIVEAMNTKGGQQLAQGSVRIPPPMDKTAVDHSTRLVARKLMDELTNSWNTMASLPHPAPTEVPAVPSSVPPAPPPATQPVPQ